MPKSQVSNDQTSELESEKGENLPKVIVIAFAENGSLSETEADLLQKMLAAVSITEDSARIMVQTTTELDPKLDLPGGIPLLTFGLKSLSEMERPLIQSPALGQLNKQDKLELWTQMKSVFGTD
jgi:DNA polymerase III psi subunit